MKNERLKWIDALKGIGIILVVLGHMTISKPLSIWIYSFHMPMFFVVSGFLYDKDRNSDILKFAMSRFKTIIVPWFVFSVISIIFSCAQNFIEPKSVNISNLLLDFLRNGEVEANLPLWFLKTLFFVEIAFAIIAKLKKTKYIAVVVFGIAIVVLLISFPFELERSLKGFVFYGIGWLVRKTNDYTVTKQIMQHQTKFGGVFLLLWIIIVFTLYVNDRSLNIGYTGTIDTILLFFVAVLGTLVATIFSKKMENLKFICYLGANSIVILGTHILVKDILSIAMRIMFNFDSEWIHQTNDLQSIFLTMAILLIEIPVIEFFNRYLPFLLGKRIDRN